MEAIVSEVAEYDRAAPRRPVSLSINEDLLSQAEALTRNLSATVEELLAGYVQQQSRKRAEGEELDQVLSALNAFHDRHGFLSDEFSDF